MEHELDMLIDLAMEYQKSKRRFMWMPTKRNRANYAELAYTLNQQKKSITKTMGTDTDKSILHSNYTTEER